MTFYTTEDGRKVCPGCHGSIDDMRAGFTDKNLLVVSCNNCDWWDYL